MSAALWTLPFAMRRAYSAIRALFQRKAAGRAAANRERRRRLRPPAILRCPLLSAVGIEGSQPGQGCGLLPADATELGHADDDRQRRSLADAGNAQHQLEPLGQIVVGT